MASIFTRIIQGEIPCYKVAEDDRYFAFLDINPLTEGHTLVVPKKETDYLFDLDDDTLAGMVLFAKRIAKRIRCRFPSGETKTFTGGVQAHIDNDRIVNKQLTLHVKHPITGCFFI